MVNSAKGIYRKRQRAEGRRQKGRDGQVKVSAFCVVLTALAIAISVTAFWR
ncbi:MAG: hypothetical protein F6J96_35790 [Symploca sp. SIO1C2]|nr:hypothetical protein [Symploca sp. SIO1C2]NER50572.1 hypothetical protein [Symploca sp. SIO1A3]